MEELLQSRDLYGLEPRNIAHYNFERVKILRGGFEVHEVREVAPEEVREKLRDPERFIFRTAADIERANETGRSDPIGTRS